MSLRWCGAVIDCHDARAQSRWWAEVLGWQVAAEDDDGTVTVLPPHLVDATREIPPAESGPGLLFQPVLEGHERRNRPYLVVAPPDGGDKEAEVRRLKALGATVVAVGEGGLDLVIMEDPEGNGFSVLSSCG
jgi:catechol 2,3-dioxygenase-like lactoylglutathione lyase family enzyme